MSRWVSRTVVLLALASAGCGAGATQGEPSKARAAVSSFLDACARGRPATAMEALTPLARRTFVRQGSGLAACTTFVGLAPPGASLSPRQRRDLLRGASVVAARQLGGEQFAAVTVRGADGATHEVDAVERGTFWSLADGPLAARRSEARTAVRAAAAALLHACARGDADRAAAVLAPSARDAFSKDATHHGLETACGAFLGVGPPALPDLKVRSLEEADPQRYAVTLGAPGGRVAELTAAERDGRWLLERP
jgi:hypothetical protein